MMTQHTFSLVRNVSVDSLLINILAGTRFKLAAGSFMGVSNTHTLGYIYFKLRDFQLVRTNYNLVAGVPLAKLPP